MNILFPKNVFTSIIAVALPDYFKNNLKFLAASAISSALEKDEDSIGLIPATDIINHKELFISRKYGISFEGSLCNSYIYFSEKRSLKNLNIGGDVSSLEAILGKILFKELYSSDVEVGLSTSLDTINDNLLLVGEQNFYEDKLFNGISFSEEIIELLSLPFVNFVLASQKESLVKESEEVFLDKISQTYDNYNSLEKYFSFSEKTLNYFKQNLSSLILEFDEQDIEGLNQLIMIPYFHGIIKEIIEAKYV
jgi:hypothetical protein